MEMEAVLQLGKIGALAALGLSAAGSALGTGAAAASAIGAWKKAYAQDKPASFILFTFVGMPLSQTIYGMILMFIMMNKATLETASAFPQALVGIGIFAGLAMGFSAWMQGRAAAGACHAMTDTGKGFTNYLMALGIVETVAIFVMVFAIIVLGATV
ncbi:MAG: V-type ATP synthase subunit K [Candidatus Sumerlaeia bacterium]